jgi:ElaB/YqjD/DUF883 family membrane-anchored ribosome-binding protein
MNYVDITIAEGDLEYLLEALDALLEMATKSEEPEAAEARRHLSRMLTSLTTQLIIAQEENGIKPH